MAGTKVCCSQLNLPLLLLELATASNGSIPMHHRGRLECARALLRAGADPNLMNKGSDLTLFWAIDGGVEMIKLLIDHGADLDARTPKDWTPLSYCKAKGKYGATEEKGIYPEVRSHHMLTLESPCPCTMYKSRGDGGILWT